MPRYAPLSPLTAIGSGVMAAAVGTVALDGLQYVRRRRQGEAESFGAFETGEGIEGWNDASAPGRIGRRVLEAFLQRRLPDSRARSVNNAMHWGYGLAWGALYGAVSGTRRYPALVAGPALGLAIFASDYAVLPITGDYKPITQYDIATVWRDATAHVLYGTVTGVAFAVCATLMRRPRT